MVIHDAPVSAHTSRLAKLGWKGLKKTPKPKTAPEQSVILDHPLGHLVDWYERLRRQNPRGLDLNPIAYSEIWAFRDLYDHEMDAFDIDTLEKLDAVWLNSLPKRSQSGRG